MRPFLNNSGVDVTGDTDAWLKTHRKFSPADLYVINTAPCLAGHPMGKQFLLTSYPSPIYWGPRGTFNPATIDRGMVISECGLQANPLEITWAPKVSDTVVVDGSGHTLLTALQAIGFNVFDNGVVEVWQALMPTPGDCNTLGACCLFSGRMGEIDINRLVPKITVHSRMEALTTMVPTPKIEPGNILAQYLPGAVPSGGPSSLTVRAGTTQSILLATGTGGPAPTPGIFEGGYLTFSTGYLAGYRVTIIAAGPSYGDSSVWAFQLGAVLPFLPAIGDTCIGYTQVVPEPEFPYVPVPINSAMITG